MLLTYLLITNFTQSSRPEQNQFIQEGTEVFVDLGINYKVYNCVDLVKLKAFCNFGLIHWLANVCAKFLS